MERAGKLGSVDESKISDREMSEMLDGKIVREREPLNLEMPIEKLDGFITPNELFYVRCHFPVPKIDIKNGGCAWKAKSKTLSILVLMNCGK